MAFDSIILIIGTTSLAIQIVIICLLIYGYNLKRKLKYLKHGATMALAVIFHATSIFAVMIPSFLAILSPDVILPEPKQLVYAAGVVHGIAGVIAFLLGIWLVATWRFRKNIQGCIKRKKMMPVTLTFWITTLVLGVFLFAVFYGPSLFG
jgi:hypothetical protein